jgi:hypothetical protein
MRAGVPRGIARNDAHRAESFLKRQQIRKNIAAREFHAHQRVSIRSLNFKLQATVP